MLPGLARPAGQALRPCLQARLLQREAGGLFTDMAERKWVKSTNEIN